VILLGDLAPLLAVPVVVSLLDVGNLRAARRRDTIRY